MPILFVIALALLAGAFVAAMAEAMARTVPEVAGWFLSAHDVLYALWPGKLVLLQIHAEAVSPLLWDPVLTGLLAVPGWLLLGVPGGLLFWWANPKRAEDGGDLDEDSLFLFDHLAEQARADGYADGSDDRAPTPFTPTPIEATLDPASPDPAKPADPAPATRPTEEG